GLNENTNGLVQQYFTKGTYFSKLIAVDAQHLEGLLNNRPVKALNCHSPNVVLAKFTARPKLMYLVCQIRSI
ncbi:MAG: hypothetical protein QMB78_06650, partial [Rhodospirillales bacterium]